MESESRTLKHTHLHSGLEFHKASMNFNGTHSSGICTGWFEPTKKSYFGLNCFGYWICVCCSAVLFFQFLKIFKVICPCSLKQNCIQWHCKAQKQNLQGNKKICKCAPTKITCICTVYVTMNVPDVHVATAATWRIHRTHTLRFGLYTWKSRWGEERFTINILCFSWKTAERLFLDAMEKIKAIGNEVTAHLFNWKMCKCILKTWPCTFKGCFMLFVFFSLKIRSLWTNGSLC